MVEALDEKESKRVRQFARALWWLIAPHLDKKAQESFKAETIAQSLEQE